MALITEDHLEQQCLEWFQELGYAYAFAPDLAPDGTTPERTDFRQVILTGRLRSALQRLNPEVPASTIESAVLQLANPNVPGLLASNRNFHRWMTQGLPITYMDGNQQVGIRLKVIGFDDPASNDWLVVNQLAIQGTKHNRRPDVVVYLNGLPLAVIELKNPADQKADIWAGFNQLQTYKQDIPDLFTPNVLLVISDGIQARLGSLSADQERFQRWRTIEGVNSEVDPLGNHRDLETLVRGIFDKGRLLEFIRSFCLFEEDGQIIKKIRRLPPVSCRQRSSRTGRRGKQTRWRQEGWSGLAHPGRWQEHRDGVFVGQVAHRSTHGEPHSADRDRPPRPGWATVRGLCWSRRSSGRIPQAGKFQTRTQGSIRQPTQRRHHLHHHSEVRHRT